jgi:hypothetical protein
MADIDWDAYFNPIGTPIGIRHCYWVDRALIVAVLAKVVRRRATRMSGRADRSIAKRRSTSGVVVSAERGGLELGC